MMASELASSLAFDIESLIDAKMNQSPWTGEIRRGLAESIDDLLKNLIFAPIDHYKIN